jgi:hypothetical protein
MYNGKEFDNMHGLNTYDYGARQYYSVLPVWDRPDPLLRVLLAKVFDSMCNVNRFKDVTYGIYVEY